MATRMTYAEQLRHPSWQRRRLEIMQRDEFRCACCSDDQTTLHVHHKHYTKGKMAWEYEDHELTTLCENCHELQHEQAEEIKQVFARLENDGPFCVGDAIAIIAGWANQPPRRDLESHYQSSPYSFVLGAVLAQIDTVAGMEDLIALYDALAAIPIKHRREALRVMVTALQSVALEPVA